MGIADGQLRFLSLSMRINDIEYQTQQVTNERLSLANKLARISEEYTNAQNATALFAKQAGTNTQKISTLNLAEKGYQVIEVKTNTLYDDYTPAEGYKKPLEEGLRDGTYVLVQKANPFSQEQMEINGIGGTLTDLYETVALNSAIGIEDNPFEAIKIKAEEEYDNEVARTQRIDKKLALQSEKYETEHKALSAEMEAVKQVIKTNSENSFKTFA